MEKATIKVRIDESLTFNLDVPLVCDVEEFSALIERSKLIFRASGATMVAGPKSGPSIEEKRSDVRKKRIYRIRHKHKNWTPELLERFIKDYKKATPQERATVLTEKYGLSSRESVEQKFYVLKKKGIVEGGIRKTRKNRPLRGGLTDSEKVNVNTLYNAGNTATQINRATGLDIKKINQHIAYQKKIGKLKKRGGHGGRPKQKPVKVVSVTSRGTKMEKILGDIFSDME
jgi:hypothetical protein